MGEKTVIIGLTHEDITEELTFHRVTEVKISEELDSDMVKTFDEPVSVPSSDGGYTVDISALEARNVQEFFTLKKILKQMKTTQGDITVKEVHKVRNEEAFEDINYLHGVTLTSNEVTYDAEDLTARELSFNAESMVETVDGEEVKWG